MKTQHYSQCTCNPFKLISGCILPTLYFNRFPDRLSSREDTTVVFRVGCREDQDTPKLQNFIEDAQKEKSYRKNEGLLHSLRPYTYGHIRIRAASGKTTSEVKREI